MTQQLRHKVATAFFVSMHSQIEQSIDTIHEELDTIKSILENIECEYEKCIMNKTDCILRDKNV